jgi:hypothetical protein
MNLQRGENFLKKYVRKVNTMHIIVETERFMC